MPGPTLPQLRQIQASATPLAQPRDLTQILAARPLAPSDYVVPVPYRAAGTVIGNGIQAEPDTKGIVQALLGMGVPASVMGILPAGALAALGTAYGVSQAIGVQYPWETGAGEGFIAPWTRDIVQDEAGRWVTRQTRPDLFGAPSTAMVPGGGAATVAVTGQLLGAGRGVVKTWDTGYTDAQGVYHPGWPFAMTSDADGKHKRIHTVTKDGVPVSWRPFRPIVLGKRMKQSMALRAVRKLQGIKDLAYRIEDLAGQGMKHSVKRSKKK